jgi:hypothetical protein
MIGMAFLALTLLYAAAAVRLLQVMKLDEQLDHVEGSSPEINRNEAHVIAC